MKRIVLAALPLLPAPALAHHPLAGAPMETLAHGVLSGIGHPVLGFDHLFFVLAVGLAARLAGLPLRGPLVYVAAMLAGCLALYAGFDVPLREPLIALSLLVTGAILASGRAGAPGAMLLILAGFGLVHGAAFGASIAGQEGGVSAAVLTGYLLGLGVWQFGLAVGAGLAGERILGARSTDAIPARLAGAAIAGVGLFLGLEALEQPLLAALAG